MATYPLLDPEIHKSIEKERSSYLGEDTNPDIVQTYRDYLAGKHLVTLTDQQKTWLRNVLNNQFCDNITHEVVAAARDRIKFDGWSSENGAVDDFLRLFYVSARVAQRQNQFHYDALGEGNTVVALAFNNRGNRVDIIDEEWWNGEKGVFIDYDDEGYPTYGVKEWKETTLPDNTKQGYFTRRNIWFEDEENCRLERWIGNGTEWTPYTNTDPQSGKEIPAVKPWQKSGGAPLHIPYIHFPNVDRGSDVYGRSEIGGGVLGFQDQLNDMQHALTSATRMTGYQMYWAKGIKPKIVAGEEIPPEVGPGRLLWSSSTDSAFGVLPAGDLTQIALAYKTKLQSVARMTRTPIHVITGGDWPSGESLLRSELPSIGKAEGQIETFRNCWMALGHRAIEIWNRFGKGQKIPEDMENALIRAEFLSPERRDWVTRVTTAQMLKGIVSQEKILRMIGIPEEEIPGIIAEMDAEKRKEMELEVEKTTRTRPPQQPGGTQS